MSRASLRKDGIDAAGAAEPPFRRVLIANRGEIALRILRACRDLRMEVVAVYSDVDADAPWVRSADLAVGLGPAPAIESYLRADAIVDAALSTGAEAIHPGYGFLAERATFARAVTDAGLVFVGPPYDAIAALGDKLAARRTASAVGVPVVPGSAEALTFETDADMAAALDAATALGFPLMVKAAAGGGGRGMRRVTDAAGLRDGLAAGSAEAASAFGDGRVYLEREIRPARHIEVQLLGDDDGTVVAIGERDCSIQRRHQKLVEEAPAPGLEPHERRTLHELAVRAATAAGLRNAATAEFLRDDTGRVWFLEVNARLQVEHGVTELVSGVDIVREQFLVAAGRPLSPTVRRAAEQAAEPGQHAIEIRLSAEDPARDFSPAPGRVGKWSMPAGPGVRVDTAIEPGAIVPPDYDPLVAKVLVVAPDRGAAIQRLRRVLAEIEITGIQTTLPFDLALAADDSFHAAELSTDWVAERWDGVADRERAMPVAARAAAAEVELSLRKDGRAGWVAATELPGGWVRVARLEATDRWPR